MKNWPSLRKSKICHFRLDEKEEPNPTVTWMQGYMDDYYQELKQELGLNKNEEEEKEKIEQADIQFLTYISGHTDEDKAWRERALQNQIQIEKKKIDLNQKIAGQKMPQNLG